MNFGAKIESKLREKQSEMRHGTETAQNADLLLFTMKIKVFFRFRMLEFNEKKANKCRKIGYRN